MNKNTFKKTREDKTFYHKRKEDMKALRNYVASHPSHFCKSTKTASPVN